MTMAEPNIEIVTVKRAHSWIVKRDQPGVRTCKTCGAEASSVVSKVCFEEEVEREIAGEEPQ